MLRIKYKENTTKSEEIYFGDPYQVDPNKADMIVAYKKYDGFIVIHTFDPHGFWGPKMNPTPTTASQISQQCDQVASMWNNLSGDHQKLRQLADKYVVTSHVKHGYVEDWDFEVKLEDNTLEIVSYTLCFEEGTLASNFDTVDKLTRMIEAGKLS